MDYPNVGSSGDAKVLHIHFDSAIGRKTARNHAHLISDKFDNLRGKESFTAYAARLGATVSCD